MYGASTRPCAPSWQRRASFELPSLLGLLIDLVSFTSKETVRAHLATTRPSVEQSLRSVDTFFESTTKANDNDPRYGIEHAWLVMESFRRFFPEKSFRRLAPNVLRSGAGKWLAAFRSGAAVSDRESRPSSRRTLPLAGSTEGNLP